MRYPSLAKLKTKTRYKKKEITYFLDKDIEEEKQSLQNTIETLGYLEQDTVQNVVAKFNTEIMDNDIEFPASEEYAVEEDGKYWYGMDEDISFFIVPVEYTGNKEKDIVDTTAGNDHYEYQVVRIYN